MSMSAQYWLGFAVYTVIVLAVGYYSYRKSLVSSARGDAEVFWTAGKRISGWAAGLSISASMMSISWSCVYGVQLFYWYGLGGLWLLAIPWLLAMAGFFVLAPRLHRLTAFSQPEMVGARFGERARQLLAIPLAFVYLVWCGAEIYAAAHVLAPLLEVSQTLMLLLIAAIVATYSFMGGFSAVVSTDRIQFALVAFFIVTIAVLGARAVVQQAGVTAFLTQLPVPPKAQGPALSPWSAGLALIAMTFVAYLPGWLVTTDVWIRMQASRTAQAARRAILVAALNSFLFVTLAPLGIGLSALYLYPPVDGAIPARLADGAAIFAAMMQDFVPPGLNVMLAVGLAAAAMSTIDTTGNVMALSLSYDLLEPWTRRRWSPALRRNLPRYITAVAIALAFTFGLFIQSLWDVFYLSSGVLTTTIFLPMVAIFLPRISPRQVHAAIIVGFVATLAFYFLEVRGQMAKLEPAWLSATGLGYILWGLVAAGIAFGGMGWWERRRRG